MENEIKSLRKIEMPEEAKKRIIEKCKCETEVKTMKKIHRKPVMLAATLAVIACLGAVTALASTEKSQGFFKDILGWNNAVVGTAYENATDEIQVTAKSEGKKIIVESVFLKTDAPYPYIQMLSVESCVVKDADGNIINENISSQQVEITDGKAVMELYCDKILSEGCTLMIDAFRGCAKAEQDLVISGNWVCTVEG